MQHIKAGKFLASLVANMEQRLFTAAYTTSINQTAAVENTSHYSDELQKFEVLGPANWPEEMHEHRGEPQIKQLAQQFHLVSRNETEGFRNYKENNRDILHGLLPLIHILNIIALSSAECECGFSLMNTIILPLRSNLSLENVSSLMFVKHNGSPLQKWDPKEYARSWLISHK